MKKGELFHLLLLVMTALIWGMAFVAQSLGADHLGPITFLTARSWLGVAVLTPLMMRTYRQESITKEQMLYLLKGGCTCGFFLFTGSLLQQMGIAYTTTANAGFITALYMIIVPIIYGLSGKKIPLQIWASVMISVFGLYLLCIRGSFQINPGDALTLACAFMFAGQILSINHFVKDCQPILLSGLQFLFCAVVGTFLQFLEPKSMADFQAALLPLLYAGIFSTGIAYTLQIIAQKNVNPTVASLVMCLESVFSALGGWLLLNQVLSPVELFGCALMFIAVLISQLPVKTTQV